MARVCLVTGANSGIGLETARGLAQRGDRVVVTARDVKRGEAAVREIEASTGSDRVELLELDLARLQSVRDAAHAFGERFDRLDVLVNNAGVMLGQRETTTDGFEMTFGVNHLGPFLFTTLLLPLLERSAAARIVNVASDAHRVSAGLDFDDLMYASRPYRAIKVYGDSKLANILFTLELARRLDGSGIVAHALHPGVVRTRLARDGDAGGWWGVLLTLVGPLLLTAAQGAATSLHLATSDEASTSSGDYWAKGKRRTPKAPARDTDAAARLWSRSEKLVGTI